MKFYYYQGDWTKGKTLLNVIKAETLTEADKVFIKLHSIDPLKNQITVTLKPFEEKINEN
jgi:hypothetical protein